MKYGLVNIVEDILRLIKRTHCVLIIDHLTLYILFCHFRPRDALMGICLLFFH